MGLECCCVSLPDPSCLVPDEASEFIRQNFRTTIRGSAVVIACIACVYATALWRVGDPHWWHHGVIALLAVVLQPCFGRQASYRGFIAALLLLILTCTVSIAVLALAYGPAALFHALLLAYTPVLVTSGRMPLWVKVVLVAAACLLALWLDAASTARWVQRAATDLNIAIDSRCLNLHSRHICRRSLSQLPGQRNLPAVNALFASRELAA